MDFIVEVGTNQQKELIVQELSSVFGSIVKYIQLPIEIKQVIIADDFDLTVNKILKLDHYKSKRGNIAFAKTIPIDDGIVLVFSHYLFSDEHNDQTRMQIFLHEYFHVFTKCVFPKILCNTKAESVYLETIYNLYDEYFANRKSFEIMPVIYNDFTKKYKKSHILHLNRFIKSISNDCDYYLKIQDEIQKHKLHRDIDIFLKNTSNPIDAVTKSLAFIYSYFDHNVKLKRLEPLLLKSKFFKNQTKNFFEFLKTNYEQNNFDLSDGIKKIENFLINLGIKLEGNESERFWCHVIDI